MVYPSIYHDRVSILFLFCRHKMGRALLFWLLLLLICLQFNNNNTSYSFEQRSRSWCCCWCWCWYVPRLLLRFLLQQVVSSYGVASATLFILWRWYFFQCYLIQHTSTRSNSSSIILWWWYYPVSVDDTTVFSTFKFLFIESIHHRVHALVEYWCSFWYSIEYWAPVDNFFLLYTIKWWWY